MNPKTLPTRILSALLAASLCAPARGAVVQGPPGQPTLPTGPGGAAGQFLSALDYHMDRVAPLLDLAPSAPAPELMAPSPAGIALPPEAGINSAVGYLARAALATPPEAQARAPEAEAARFLAAVLADPAERSRAVQALREKGGDAGQAAAEKIEGMGQPVSGMSQLSLLSADLAHAPDVNTLDVILFRFFNSSLPQFLKDTAFPLRLDAQPIPPEEFVAHAERRFGAGLSRAAVVSAPAPAGAQTLPSDGELHDRVALSPLTNPERERVVVELFQRAGAAPQEIVLQDAGEGRHNIYVVKKGRTDRVVVVGGHHDKVRQGAGTIDNWTGATMVINLYQALRDVDTEATYIFTAFAREEEGLLGSQAFLEALTPEQKAKVDSMVNLDTLAVDGTFSWKNNSTRSLLDLIKQVALAERLDLVEYILHGGDADSTSFRRAGIPAITVFGASNEVIWDIIHSVRDTIASFALPHYKNAYLLVLALLKRLDREILRPAGA